MNENLQDAYDLFMNGLKKRNPGQTEFHQAVQEFIISVLPFVMDHKLYRDNYVLERLTEPDRVISFRVTWQDDEGNIRANRGYRVQFNNSIGPYKGGLRFHPSVNESILKFLAFEQIFKNSLTTLPMGAGKGGANFNPKGKSEREIMRFCQAFMNELYKYIGANKDVPAGDIGVGKSEISYMFGQYKKLKGEFTGVLTGKQLSFGGSLIRPEATGYGCVYFLEEALKLLSDSVLGKKCLISGSGNVAQHCAEKLIILGAKVLTLSDSSGTIYDPDGIDQEKLEFVKDLKNSKRGRISEYQNKYPKSEYLDGETPWNIEGDLVFPCATQNELNLQDAKHLIKHNCKAVVEGANMPCTIDAMKLFQEKNVLFAPAKAANAGGVAVSGLEMAQNSMRMTWTREETDQKLRNIMSDIHRQCVEYGKDGKIVNYVKGANIAGFVKVADAMIAQGVA